MSTEALAEHARSVCRSTDNIRIIGAPSSFDLELLLRGFLVRLCALDTQLLDNRGETTFAVVVETKDGLEPAHKGDGVSDIVDDLH